MRLLSDRLGTTDVAVNHYTLAPGESFTISPHSHAEQEEVFVVLAGTITFETAESAVSVGADELVRVPPGTVQLGTNREDEPATALALGAPKEYAAGGRWKLACDDCGTITLHDHRTGEEEAYVCRDCGAVFGST